MRTALMAFTALFVGALAAGAQTTDRRFYVAATCAADGGFRGPITGSAVASAGALFGARLTAAWGVEVEVDRGLSTISASDEAVWVSYPPMQNPTREEIERYGIRARFDRTQKAGAGWAAHAVWRRPDPGRVRAALLVGVSSRVYRSSVNRTVTFVPPELNLPSTHDSVQNGASARRMVAAGLSAGLLVIVRVTPSVTIAPEVRSAGGVITDDPYAVFRLGLRAMWSF